MGLMIYTVPNKFGGIITLGITIEYIQNFMI